jgi:hypothetical protein
MEVDIFKLLSAHLKFDYIIREPKICCMWGVGNEDLHNLTGNRAEMYYNYSDIGDAYI